MDEPHQVSLQAAEEHGLIEGIPALVYRATADSNWKAHFLSSGTEALTGYPPERFVGPDAIHFFQLIHPDDQAKARTALDEAIASKTEYHSGFRIIRADGQVRHVQDHGRGAYDEDGNLLHVDGVVVDVTELQNLNHQLADQKQKLRKLARALGNAEEQIRHHVTGVLHEDLQQVLVACSLKLGMMPSSSHDDARHLHAAQELIDNAIRISRKLVGSLQPPSLAEGELAPAFEMLTDWFRDHFGLQVTVNATAGTPLPRPLAKFLFQAARELLFNVFKHADTEEAVLTAKVHGQDITLTVTDQGKGFNPQHRLSAQSFGLTTLQTRVESQLGELQITSAPGQGTRVQITLPVNALSDQPAAAELAAGI